MGYGPRTLGRLPATSDGTRRGRGAPSGEALGGGASRVAVMRIRTGCSTAVKTGARSARRLFGFAVTRQSRRYTFGKARISGSLTSRGERHGGIARLPISRHRLHAYLRRRRARPRSRRTIAPYVRRRRSDAACQNVGASGRAIGNGARHGRSPDDEHRATAGRRARDGGAGNHLRHPGARGRHVTGAAGHGGHERRGGRYREARPHHRPRREHAAARTGGVRLTESRPRFPGRIRLSV